MSARERPLRRRDLDADPLRQFERWYEEAARVVEFPETVALATSTEAGSPSVRMVLAKGFDERGFKFHTGHGSRKARELAATGRGALLFYWHPLGRQVRIEGPVERVSDEESEEYFRTRPRGGQIAARAAMSRSRRTGAAIAWNPRSGSSGSTARAASTIASATSAMTAAGGRSHDSLLEPLLAFGERSGPVRTVLL